MKADTLRWPQRPHVPRIYCPGNHQELEYYRFLHHKSENVKGIAIAGFHPHITDTYTLERGHAILKRAFMGFIENPKEASLTEKTLYELYDDRKRIKEPIIDNTGTVCGAIELGVIHFDSKTRACAINTFGKLTTRLCTDRPADVRSKVNNSSWDELEYTDMRYDIVPSVKTRQITMATSIGLPLSRSILFHSEGLRHPEDIHPSLDDLIPDTTITQGFHPKEQAAMLVYLGN